MPDRLGRSQRDAERLCNHARRGRARAGRAGGNPRRRPAGDAWDPDRLAGFRHLVIIAIAIVAGAAMVAGPHRLARAAASGARRRRDGRVCAALALPGAFPGDHGDVGNWRCPLGIAALSALVQAASPRVR